MPGIDQLSSRGLYCCYVSVWNSQNRGCEAGHSAGGARSVGRWLGGR